MKTKKFSDGLVPFDYTVVNISEIGTTKPLIANIESQKYVTLTVALDNTDATFPTRTFKVNIFENSQPILFEHIEQILLKYNNIPQIACDHIQLEGNYIEKYVPYYIPHVRDNEGKTRPLQATHVDKKGTTHLEDAISSRMTYFVHADEDKDIEEQKIFNHRVKPYIIQK